MGKLRINTNLPVLSATIFHDNKIIYENSIVSNSKVIPYFDNKNTEEVQGTEFLLDKGIYSVRLSLPYCNPGDIEDNKEGVMFHMPLVMDKLVMMQTDESFVELNFFVKLEEVKLPI
jgi:hypothetical protein